MQIELKQLFDIVGERKEIDYALDLSGDEAYGTRPFQTPVRVKGELFNRAGVVTAKLDIRFTLHVACDRCLVDFTRDFELGLTQILVTEQPQFESSLDWDAEHFVAENYRLDVDELVRSYLLLELPMKMLCKEDCRGLCPVCGANLNEGSCKCGAAPVQAD